MCRSPLANRIQPSAMRWRVGRRPTSRSLALTSCQGQPLSSARHMGPRRSVSGGLEITVVRVAAIVLEPCHLVWNNAKFVTFAIIYDLAGQMQLLRNKPARILHEAICPKVKCVAVLTFPYP